MVGEGSTKPQSSSRGCGQRAGHYTKDSLSLDIVPETPEYSVLSSWFQVKYKGKMSGGGVEVYWKFVRGSQQQIT